MKKPITVYWSPGVEYWNLLYPEPKTVIQNLIKHKNNIKDDVNFFSCPAVTNKGKRTYSFEFLAKTNIRQTSKIYHIRK